LGGLKLNRKRNNKRETVAKMQDTQQANLRSNVH